MVCVGGYFGLLLLRQGASHSEGLETWVAFFLRQKQRGGRESLAGANEQGLCSSCSWVRPERGFGRDALELTLSSLKMRSLGGGARGSKEQPEEG